MKFRGLIAAAVLCTLCVGQASALEYTVDAPEDYLFGTPTSEGTVYEQESNNVDRGKNTALIPPGFGTATSYLPGSGEPLTPNLLPSAMSGGLISSVKTDSSEVSYPTVDSTADHWTGASFTAVTPNLYYNDDHLGITDVRLFVQFLIILKLAAHHFHKHELNRQCLIKCHHNNEQQRH